MSAPKPFTRDQARGMLVGLAVGDALGTTLEFLPRGSFEPIDDMVGGGPFQLKAGQWTDDTSMALCLGHSVLQAKAWDAADAMRRFVNWRDHGYMSSTGECFDIGNQTSVALDRFLATGDPYAGPTDDSRSGNGGIMRLAPMVLAFGSSRAGAQRAAVASSDLTHASPMCRDAAARMADFLVSGDAAALPHPKDPPREASGFVRHTEEAAFWALAQGGGFRDIVLRAVNLGGDADTVGAVVGQLAGRVHGHSGIPQDWCARLQDHDAILGLADALYDLTLTFPTDGDPT